MPLFSILTPVYEPPADALADMLASVVGQTFSDWELICVNDASPSAHVGTQLDQAAAADPRIRVVHRSVNGGITVASQQALEAATGEFVVLLDHDDTLELWALGVVAAALDADPTIDYLYTDEDKLSVEGHYVEPFYKPDWSPERLRAQNYCCHLSVLRRSLALDVGGFRQGFEGSQDYDIILRVTEQARTVHHLAEVLYHWRKVPQSVASDPSTKPYAFEAGQRAVQDHCDRVGIDAVVESDEHLGTYRVRRRMPGEPLVSVVIPTRGSSGRVWGIERCFVVEAVRSLVETATYDNVEFVVVADDVTPEPVIAALRRLAGERLKLVWYDRPFNFSEKVNVGRVHATGELILVLNDDVELITPDVVEAMAPLALEPDVGSVGAKLLFSDGTLQHAGHVYTGQASHAFFRRDGNETGPSALLAVQRECIGVTAACLMLRPEVFDSVGGFSPVYASNFNDVDFALKLRHFGYRNVWTPHARLYHFESVTRDPTVSVAEHEAINRRWMPQLQHDPYHNINLEGHRDDWVERGMR